MNMLGINNLLVIGTGNLSERTVGYFTKWGDGAYDFNPIANLTKQEVYVLARYLQVPDSIINKKPSADLWEGQTDEDDIGIKYEEIDKFILTGTSGNTEIDSKIQDRNDRNMHKLRPVPMFDIEAKRKVAIIAAMEQELSAIKDKFDITEERKLRDLTYYVGELNNKEYILIRSGIGKVNAARVTQMLIDNFDIEYIINVGTAGGLNDNLEIGDIVIGQDLVQHDFDTTAFGDEKGYITGTGKIFKSDEKLISRYKNYISENKQSSNIIVGTIASGDIFCTEKCMKEKIHTKFGADCVEMEGAAIAQICKLNNMPFMVMRSISDKPNGENQIDFNKFIEMASKNAAEIIWNCEKHNNI